MVDNLGYPSILVESVPLQPLSLTSHTGLPWAFSSFCTKILPRLLGPVNGPWADRVLPLLFQGKITQFLNSYRGMVTYPLKGSHVKKGHLKGRFIPVLRISFKEVLPHYMG